MRIYCLIFISLFFIQLKAQKTMDYLALGDSYTIGEAVPSKDNWPNQLVSRLQDEGVLINEPYIIATTGWRTDELIEAIQKDKKVKDKYDLVSLLIGVNNQYQKKSLEVYEKDLRKLVSIAIEKSVRGAQGVFMVGIPDYGHTEYAKEKNLTNVAENIEKFNRVASKIAKEYNLPFYPLFTLSQKFFGQSDMFVEDQLHPSAKQYGEWVNSFYEQLKKDRISD